MNIVHISLEGVTKAYGGVIAVDNLNLSVYKGELLTLLGPSGCGKTTTLRMIGGFVSPSEGRILINDVDITQLPPQKRPTAMVFQSYALFPHMTVRENVAFGLTVRGLPSADINKKVYDALELVRLEGVDARYPAELSGGQQQRVALARALAVEPEVILMDEPLGSLDAKLREILQLELKRIQRELGTTTIYVTHDQEEALGMSDRIAVMSRGRIMQIDKPDTIYRLPTNRFVADFIGKVNMIPGWIEAADPYVLKTKDGRHFLVYANTPKATASPGLLIIRPEHMRFSESGLDPNQIDGTVEKIKYTGASYYYFIQASPQLTLTVEERSVSPTHQVGDNVTVGWTPEQAIVIFEDQLEIT